MAPPIIEPPASDFEPEHRGLYRPLPEAHIGAIVQGSVAFAGVLVGDEDDSFEKIYEVRLLVGPFWRDVQNVVPKVTVDGFRNNNADEDDIADWRIRNLSWDTVGEFGPSQDESRIRLRFEVFVQGEHSQVINLGYYLMASGRRLGEGGLSEPGPVKRQG